MNKLKLLLLGLIFVGCNSNEDEDICDCTKTTYTYEQGVTTGSNGLPTLTFEKVILSSEQVSCQPEQEQADAGDNVYFDIDCD